MALTELDNEFVFVYYDLCLLMSSLAASIYIESPDVVVLLYNIVSPVKYRHVVLDESVPYLFLIQSVPCDSVENSLRSYRT